MKNSKRYLSRISLCICILLIIMLTAACDSSTKPKPVAGNGTVSGTAYAANNSPLDGVVVSIGNLQATTGTDGKFVISNVPVSQHALVDFVKPGYISTQKVVNVIKNRTTNTVAVLFTAVTMTFPSNDVAIIIDGSASVEVPANAFVSADGTAFSGNIYAEVKFFDPMDPAALAAFPGEFVGTQTNGSETDFESYGFISASFYDAANPTTELQLGSGKTAHLVTPISAALIGDAPATIPMWYYNETTGKWMEQGTGTKSANGLYYVGDVSHFTYWNFDHPIEIIEQSTLTGTVVLDDSLSTPVSYAQVVANGVDYAGYTRVYSDANGHFSLTVKASSQVRVQAYAGQNTSPQTDVINTPANGGSAVVGDLIISDLTFTLTGTLVNASGVPYANAYPRVQQINVPAGTNPFVSWLNTDANGVFSTTATMATPGTTIQLQFSTMDLNATFYSNPVSLVVPYPGDSFNFGTVTLRTGGNITGRLKTSNGTYLSGGTIFWNQQGGSGAGEVFFNAPIDTEGNFTVTGPPSTTLTNMVAMVQSGPGSYVVAARSLTFPASGATNDIGDVVVIPSSK